MNTNYTISEPLKSALTLLIRSCCGFRNQVVLGDAEVDLGSRPVGPDALPLIFRAKLMLVGRDSYFEDGSKSMSIIWLHSLCIVKLFRAIVNTS